MRCLIDKFCPCALIVSLPITVTALRPGTGTVTNVLLGVKGSAPWSAFSRCGLRSVRLLHGSTFGHSLVRSSSGLHESPRRGKVPRLQLEAGGLLGAGVLGVSALGVWRLIQTESKRVRVVTDIDDTVKSSGNARLAGIPLGGIDAQYKRGTFYPGVFQFALELARYQIPPGETPLAVAVLTARARELLFALEIGEDHPISVAYRSCGDANGVPSWGLGPVLYGSVQEWICTKRKGWRKMENFTRLLEKDDAEVPRDLSGKGKRQAIAEGGYIFVGDTGEGDTVAGNSMCAEYPELMRAVFLHFVSNSRCQGGLILPEDRLVEGVPVAYFRTYVGASVKAVKLGLMGRDGMERVIASAKKDLAGVPMTCSKWADLLQDLKAAGKVQPPAPGAVSVQGLSQLLMAAQERSTASGLSTPPRVPVDVEL